MTILETTRLMLREFTPADVDALARILSDPETMRYYPAPYNRTGVEQWIARNRQRYQDDGVGLWAMVMKSADELIGDCGIVRQEIEGERHYEKGDATTKSDTICAAISGARASPPKPPSPAETGDSHT